MLRVLQHFRTSFEFWHLKITVGKFFFAPEVVNFFKELLKLKIVKNILFNVINITYNIRYWSFLEKNILSLAQYENCARFENSKIKAIISWLFKQIVIGKSVKQIRCFKNFNNLYMWKQ